MPVKEWARYALAVAGYIALSLATKKYLTWTYGPTYFIVTLEVLPRTWRRLRRLVQRPRPRDDAEPAPAEAVGAPR